MKFLITGKFMCLTFKISPNDISNILPSEYKLVTKEYLNGVWVDN